MRMQKKFSILIYLVLIGYTNNWFSQYLIKIVYLVSWSCKHRTYWYINCKINVIRLLEEHFLLLGSSLRSFDFLIFSRTIKIYLLTLRLYSHSPPRSPAIYLALSPSSGYINCRVVEHSKRLSLGMSDTFENVLHLFGSDLHTTYVYIYKRTYVKSYAKTAAATTTTTTTSTGR